MLGAIIGDIVGSIFEHDPVKTTEFDLFSDESCFTDDTVLTVAVAEHLLENTDLSLTLRKYHNLYPRAGYGSSFRSWTTYEDPKPYNSFGNGSAMRVSPVGHFFDDLETTLKEAKKSAEVTHNHPEGIKGAQAAAAAIFLGRNNTSKDQIRSFIADTFNYDLNRSVSEMRDVYSFDVSCQGSVPESIICFLDSSSFEDAIRLAISLGGDADTMAAISGSIAEAFYRDIPGDIVDMAIPLLDSRLHLVLERFYETLGKQGKAL